MNLKVGESFPRDDYIINVERIFYFISNTNVFYCRLCIKSNKGKSFLCGFITVGRPDRKSMNNYLNKFLPDLLKKHGLESV